MTGRTLGLMIRTGDMLVEVKTISYVSSELDLIVDAGLDFPDVNAWPADGAAGKLMTLAEDLMYSGHGGSDEAVHRRVRQLAAQLIVDARVMSTHYLTTVAVK